MDGTVLQQGSFIVASGAAGVVPQQIIQIPANADFMWVKNFTQTGVTGSTGPAIGYKWYWQRGMAAGTGLVSYNTNAALTAQDDQLISGGFTLFDPSGQSVGAQPQLGPSVSFSAITNVMQPVVTTGSTASLVDGISVVRLSKLAGDTVLASDILGVDFVATVVSGTQFEPLAAFPNNPGLTTGTGHWRIVNYDPLFYPRRRTIANITQATNAQVTTTVFHQLTPGQAIRFNIPAQSGMIELNSTSQNNYAYATVVQVVDSLNFTINIDTTGFTLFSYPTVAQVNGGSQLPEMNPIGENSPFSLSSNTAQVPLLYSNSGPQINSSQVGMLADATVNTGYLGMILGGIGSTPSGGSNVTVSGPAGYAANDVVYWVAGKSAFGGL